MASKGSYWQAQLNRRELVKRAALGSAGLTATAVISCGRQQQQAAPTAPGAAQPKQGGILSRAGGPGSSWDTRANTLDPHVNSSVVAMTQRLYYQGLLSYDLRSKEVEPELAQRWEQPSPTEYIFTLQPGVKWHNKPPVNGRELTMDDVVFSLNRARTDEPLFQHRSVLEAVDRIEALDKTRIKITTKIADAGTLSGLSGDGALVLAPEVLEKTGGKIAPLAENAIGTGAFIAKSIEQDVAAEYVRNPVYWKPGRPYLDGFRSLHFADNEAGYAAFLGNRVHLANLPGTKVKEYIARQGPAYTPDWSKEMGLFLATPNVRQKPLDDPRVTRALRLFLDHDSFKTAWGESFFGRGEHKSVLPPGLDAWDFSEEEYSKRIFWKQPKDAAAKEGLDLLAAAGFTKDNPLKFELITSGPGTLVTASELAQSHWRRFGQGVVEATIKVFDLTELLPIQARGTFTYGIFGFSIGTNDPGAWLFTLYHSRGSRNRMFLRDIRLDAMIDRQQGIFDIQQRKAAIREIVSYMMDNSPGVQITGRFALFAVHPAVRDYVTEDFWMHGNQYERVWLDT